MVRSVHTSALFNTGKKLDWYLWQLAQDVIFVLMTLGHYTVIEFGFNTRELNL